VLEKDESKRENGIENEQNEQMEIFTCVSDKKAESREGEGAGEDLRSAERRNVI
jgi:hypothetical protein